MNRYIILSAAAALLATACGKKEEDKKADAMDVLPLVEVETVHVAAVDQIHEYTANVDAYKSNNISPATSNRIKTITVDMGDHVRRGQVLVTMDNSEAARLKVNLDQIQREYNRATQLLKIGSGTQAQVDQLKAQLDASRTQYNNVI